MDNLLYYTGIGLAVGAIGGISFLFGVPYFKDPLVLHYKNDSNKRWSDYNRRSTKSSLHKQM